MNMVKICTLGITTRWKQTIAYYLTGSSVDGALLKPIILDILRSVQDVGISVCIITSDMGPNNQAMWRSFGVSAQREGMVYSSIPHPVEPTGKSYFMADVSYVIKKLKSMLIKHELTLHHDTVSNTQI